MSKFFDKKILDQIIIHRDQLPAIAPGDARAYTSNESEIWFNKGEYQPNAIGGRGIPLIAHEVQHIVQWRSNWLFPLLYLGDSAAIWAVTGDPEIAYQGNAFEIEARKKEAEVLDDIKKNGNPCP